MKIFYVCHRAEFVYLAQAKEEYEFKSGGIIDTLKDLKAKFEKRAEDLQTEEDAAQQSYDAAAGAKREQIETDKATLETEEENLETTKSASRARQPS